MEVRRTICGRDHEPAGVHDTVTRHRAGMSRGAEASGSFHWMEPSEPTRKNSTTTEQNHRTGLLSELTKTIGDQGLSITSALVSTTTDRLAKVRLTFECSDPKHLAEVIAQLRKVSGVYDVDRVSQGG